MTAQPTIVVVCGDPGGAAAVAPVIHALSSTGQFEVRPFAYREALQQWQARGIQASMLDEALDECACERILHEMRAALLLTGTSANGVDLEKKFVVAARSCDVPTVAVLDFWSNYRERFADESGDLAYLPDRIMIMDEQAHGDMISEGFDSGKLLITGQPAFDDLSGWLKAMPPDLPSTTRRALGVCDNDLLVVFASQAIAEAYGPDSIASGPLGFNEWSVLQEVIGALEAISRRRGRSIVLLIRPHPHETVDKFRDVRSEVVRVIVTKEHASRAVVVAADLVCGMNSAFLVEACYLGALTVSLQPDLRCSDPLPTNRLGLSRPVYRSDQTQTVLEELLFDSAERARQRALLSQFQPAGDASLRVVQVIREILSRSTLPIARS